MKILQFAFDSREESDYLPHNYTHNCVVYTGTHDNDTVMGWYDTLKGAEQKLCDDYTASGKMRTESRFPESSFPGKFVRAAMSSVADLAINSHAGYLGLGSEARINIPSTLGINWKWRIGGTETFTKELAGRIRSMTKLYGR
mgnify:CR=1 FL=1